jgi:hypothetical protein
MLAEQVCELWQGHDPPAQTVYAHPGCALIVLIA